MRLAIVTTSISRLAGGLFQSVRRSALALQSCGVDVTVFGISDPYTEEDYSEWYPIQPNLVKRLGPNSLGFAPTLSKLLLAGNFDIVHQHGIWTAISKSVLDWRNATGRPVVISPRGMLDTWALQNAQFKKRIASALYESSNVMGASCIHALNSSEHESIRKYGYRGPIATIPNGTGLPNTVESPGLPEWLPNDNRKILLFLGRLHPKKGITELLDAWSILLTNSDSGAKCWRLVIAGWDDGHHLEHLIQKCSKLGLEKDVVFAGPLFGENKDVILRSADAFILPSYSEGLPIAVLEAWAYALPVLKTEYCNLQEGFDAGAALRISLSAQQMAEDIQVFFHMPENEQRKIGKAGRSLVESSYQWSTIAHKQLEAYRWLTNPSLISTPECISEVS